MTAADDIIDYIRRNRVSTTEVTDAMGKVGVIPSLIAMTPDQLKVGRARCIFTANNSNYAVHEQARSVREGEVVIIFASNCEGRAIIGDLITKYLLLYMGAAAVVIDGLVRDAARIRRERHAVWAQGVSPLGCYNRPAAAYPSDDEAAIRRRVEGGVAVCDEGGVTVIPPDWLNADMLERLKRIELQEDIWYYCLDTLKWDTKRIVCDKAYLTEPDLLPAKFREVLTDLEKPFDQPA